MSYASNHLPRLGEGDNSRMNTADIELLIDYNYWANTRILDQAAKLTDEQFTQPQPPGFSPGTFKKTLVHTMGAEWIWRMRCQHGVSPTALLAEADFPTLDMVVRRWDEEHREMRAFAASITDAQLAQVMDYNSTSGAPGRQVRGQCLTHMVFHGMQHRSECAVLLTNYGFSPGNIDLIYYLIVKGTP